MNIISTRHRTDCLIHYCWLKRCQNGPDYLVVKFYNSLPEGIRNPAQQFKVTHMELPIHQEYSVGIDILFVHLLRFSLAQVSIPKTLFPFEI